ncbi:hypothetical protein ABZ897_61045 [Nonomuraea sp. NPDC046802]|uniref:hypothetical protein n=1 Tax=Nonomuraea sp. NPDC046802 TaxID=3154919 RepID=UPI0033E315B8
MEWSAPADGSTLRRVPSPISHATTNARLVFDDEAGHWTLAIQIHHEDGSSQDGFLIVGQQQVPVLVEQFRTQERTR